MPDRYMHVYRERPSVNQVIFYYRDNARSLQDVGDMLAFEHNKPGFSLALEATSAAEVLALVTLWKLGAVEAHYVPSIAIPRNGTVMYLGTARWKG
jgi:hypothetical protein